MQIDSSNLMQLGRIQQQQAGSRHNISSLQSQANNAGKGTEEKEELKKACSDFQAIFVKQMLDSMRKTVNKTGLLDGGQAEEIFEDMLYDEYAQKISKTGNLGLDEMMYRQLS